MEPAEDDALNPDVDSYEAWQKSCGFTGSSAKWPPERTSWAKLKVPKT